MPRYFFNIRDGHTAPDTEGTELPDIYTAQAEAIAMSGEILRDMGADLWNGSEWRLEVCDAQTCFVPASALSYPSHPTTSSGTLRCRPRWNDGSPPS